MRTLTVTDPAGTQWRVRVVWQPRWRALARRFGRWRRQRRSGSGDIALDASLDAVSVSDTSSDLFVGIVVVVGLIVGGLLFWWLLLPLLLLVIDIVVVMVLAVVTVATRVLFRRPWTVEAADGTNRYITEVLGWRHALRVRDEIAEKLRAGDPASA